MKPGKKPKKGKGTAPASETAGWRAAVRPLLAAAITIGVTVGVLGALGWLDDEARRKIADRDRYAARFADIECDAPAGLGRSEFLTEVRYAANAAETFQVLDPELRAKLTAAFTSHPWVESVESVTVDPPATVRVGLKFRTPFLAIRVEGGTTRTVDANGVLLPAFTLPPNLTEVITPLPQPTTPAGQVWASDDVRRAVELAKLYPLRKLDRTPKGWRLTRADGAVLTVGER
ncbi:MAG TPA: hypothetical protein VMZ71_09425 [Gemmataceae bacterium]|nr:hypothetical protein [Gemmataceae bacterium]